MIDEVQGIKEEVKQRFRNPIIASILISLLIYNWDLTIVIIFGETTRLDYIRNIFIPGATFVKNVVCPTILGLIFFILMYGLKFLVFKIDMAVGNFLYRMEFNNTRNRAEIDAYDNTFPGIIKYLVGRNLGFFNELNSVSSNLKSFQDFVNNRANAAVSLMTVKDSSEFKLFSSQLDTLSTCRANMNNVIKTYETISKKSEIKIVSLESTKESGERILKNVRTFLKI